MNHSLLLHETNLYAIPLRGHRMATKLEARAEDVVCAARTISVQDFGISIVIRTRNDERYIGGLFEDLKACQELFTGPVEVIVVDTESTDRTLSTVKRYSKDFSSRVTSMTQATFSYPKGLNLAFEAAHFNNVLTLVGHSALSNKATLLTATKYAQTDKFGGAFGWTLPNSNASVTERLIMVAFRVSRYLAQPARRCLALENGIMGANCSLVRRDVWKNLGGYDERYAAGGEDRDFARRAIAQGYVIMAEPVLSLYHSHGLGPINTFRQNHYWHTLDKPRVFNPVEVAKYRGDLGLSEKG